MPLHAGSLPLVDAKVDSIVQVISSQLLDPIKGDYVLYEDRKGRKHVGWVTRPYVGFLQTLKDAIEPNDLFVIWEDSEPKIPTDSYVRQQPQLLRLSSVDLHERG